MAQRLGFAAFKKAGKFYFLQSSQNIRERRFLASKKPSLVQLPCAKTREFGEAEFSDCLPVSALVCVFAFDTGGLGLWLVAFEKSGFYRCQSVPGPPMPCFVAQSFGVWYGASFWQPLQPWFVKETAFFFAKVQNLRIRLVPNSWIVMPVFCGTELGFCTQIMAQSFGL